MIAAKGYAVVLYLEGGRVITPDPKSALLHDEEGAAWPKCSGLILPMKKTGQPLEEIPSSVRKYLGKDYVVRRGEVVLPPVELATWKALGPCERIDYTRRGAYADNWFHPFERGGFLAWKGRAPHALPPGQGAPHRARLGVRLELARLREAVSRKRPMCGCALGHF